MVFSPAQWNIRIRFSTPGRRSLSGSLAQSAASGACGPCTASNGTCHTRRFSDPYGIYPAAGRRHRKYPCRRAQADCGRAIHVAHVVVQQKLGASASLTAQRPSSAAGKPRSGLAVGWSDWSSCSPLLAGEVVPQRLVDSLRVRKRIRQIRVDDDYVVTILESLCELPVNARPYEFGRIFRPEIVVFMLIHKLAAHGVSSGERI